MAKNKDIKQKRQIKEQNKRIKLNELREKMRNEIIK